MLGFWIALGLVVAGVLAAMAFYALKAWHQGRPTGRDRAVRTTRAGRRAR